MLDTKYIKALFDNDKSLEEKKESFLTSLKKEIINLESTGGYVLKLSKQVISSVISNKLSDAKKKLEEGEGKIKDFEIDLDKLKKKIAEGIKNSTLQLKDLQQVKLDSLEGNFENAKEEFLEAKILITFFEKGGIYKPNSKNLKDFNIYAGGLSDFCGELVRIARLATIQSTDPVKDVTRYLNVTSDAYEQLSAFAFSNASGNRQKIEQLKSFIRAFEEILYDLRCKPTEMSHVSYGDQL